jgi:23S rRNA (guanine745-N1)-methyltransferase
MLMERTILTCPLCGGDLTQSGKTWSCPKNHSFDVAKQGYVNLLPVQQKHSKNPGDTRDMVAARRSFLEKGHYEPIARRVAELLRPVLPESPTVLDAGCGEGYYLSQLQDALGTGNFLGVDISKEAVRYAAGRNKNALWITASAAHLPVQSGSLDAVLSMFALTVPEEFSRVLRPQGYFLEVTAGRGHLMGLKSLIYSELIEKQEKHPDCPGFQLVSQETLEFPISLTEPGEVQELLSMTPHFWRITKEGAQRAAAAEGLQDMAQVEFRLYQRIASFQSL